MRLKEWRGTQRIAVGGGLRASRIGEFTIGRTAGLLKAASLNVELRPIRHDLDEAGLIGCIHLAPPCIFSGHDSSLAIDIGGSNIRVGTIELDQANATDLSRSKVDKFELWRRGR